MPLRSALLAAAIALLPACYDVPTGATPASDPSGGLGVVMNVENTDLSIEAGPDGMGMAFASPEGDRVSMGVKVTDGGQGATMGVAFHAADGVGMGMEFVGSEDGAQIRFDLDDR